MRVLIVGGTSALAQVLKPVLSGFAEVLTAGRAHCDIQLDLSAPAEEVRIPEGIDSVINLAAHFGGGRDSTAMLDAENVNVHGSLKLCQACTRAGARHLVLVSSVFASLGSDSPFYGIYALSKRHAEEVAELYSATQHLPLTVLRPAQIYGVGEPFRKHQPFLYAIIDKAERNEDITFYGSNDARRNLIHAEDVSNVIARVLQQRVEGRYACASSSNVSYSEIARSAIAAFGSTATFRFLKDKPDIADNAFGPDETLYQRIQYFPRIGIALGMEMEAAHRAERK